MKSRVLIASALLAVAMMAASVFPTLAQDPAVPQAGEVLRHITVVGRGTVNVSPDVATINVGAETQAEDVAEAVAQNAETMDRILAALEEAGVAEEDIQTSEYSIFFDEGFRGADVPPQPTFRVFNMVRVIIRDLDRLGEFIGVAVDAGANRLFGVSFALSDTAEAEATAREEAVADARQRAEHLASLVGASVGEVISVSEVVMGAVPFPSASAFDMGAGGPGIVPGQLEFTTNIQVIYALGPAEAKAVAPVAQATITPGEGTDTYSLSLIPVPSPSMTEEGRTLAATVEVRAEGEDEPAQTLEVLFRTPFETAEQVDLWAEEMDLIVEDINFDGFQDFAVTEPGGANWQVSHWYLYDEEAGEFITNEFTEQLSLLPWASYSLDPVDQTITVTNRLGATGSVETVYLVHEGELVLVSADPDAPTIESGPFSGR
ncbi:MAG: SIMPL domain-containing protein [Anaerolineae bacterium]|nr:SIMPL domain-containing protein [Anaerolineae bacterium]